MNFRAVQAVLIKGRKKQQRPPQVTVENMPLTVQLATKTAQFTKPNRV